MVWQEHFLRLAPLIQQALDRGNKTHTLEDIYKGLEIGQFQLWPAEDGVAVTEVIGYPRKKVLFFFLMAGKMSHVLANAGKVEQVARDLGCNSIMLNGRRGWTRSPLSRQGYKPVWVTMEKEL